MNTSTTFDKPAAAAAVTGDITGMDTSRRLDLHEGEALTLRVGDLGDYLYLCRGEVVVGEGEMGITLSDAGNTRDYELPASGYVTVTVLRPALVYQLQARDLERLASPKGRAACR